MVKEGYRIELISLPQKTGKRVTRLRDGLLDMSEEVSKLLEKCAVKPVPPGQEGKGFYSTYFTVPKKDGGKRPILNLKPFNRHADMVSKM